jgi:uncharacterized protein
VTRFVAGQPNVELPLAVRDHLTDLLVVALRDRVAARALEQLARRVSRGAAEHEIACADGATPWEADDILVELGLRVRSAEPGRPRGREAARSTPADRRRVDPAWRPAVAARLAAYVAVLHAAPTGTDLAAALAQATVLFGANLNFEVHELLEPHWRSSLGAERCWLQGVIQAAVARYHLERGNLRGASKVAGAAAAKLAAAPERWCGFALAAMGRACADLAEEAADEIAAELDRGVAARPRRRRPS